MPNLLNQTHACFVGSFSLKDDEHELKLYLQKRLIAHSPDVFTTCMIFLLCSTSRLTAGQIFSLYIVGPLPISVVMFIQLIHSISHFALYIVQFLFVMQSIMLACVPYLQPNYVELSPFSNQLPIIDSFSRFFCFQQCFILPE